jgi:hypothetical protein
MAHVIVTAPSMRGDGIKSLITKGEEEDFCNKKGKAWFVTNW